MKVLFIQDGLRHYRSGLMEALGGLVELTLLQPGRCPELSNVEIVVVKYIRWNKFIWIRNLRSIIRASQADIVIFPYDVYWLNWLTLLNFKKRIVWFGLGMGKNKLANMVRVQLSKLGSTILYSNKDVKFLGDYGVDLTTVTVAHNTLKVSEPVRPYEKNGSNFLFVGTLDERKNLKSLIDAFHLFLHSSRDNRNIKLQIIGDGPLLARLKEYVSQKSLDDSVEFLGRIESESALRNYYSTALACVSYGQLGLTCLQSMANATPVITCKDAISGGEITNIKHGENGFLLDNNVNLWSQTLENVSKNKLLLDQLTQQAFDHYWEKRTISHMAGKMYNHMSKILNNNKED